MFFERDLRYETTRSKLAYEFFVPGGWAFMMYFFLKQLKRLCQKVKNKNKYAIKPRIAFTFDFTSRFIK